MYSLLNPVHPDTNVAMLNSMMPESYYCWKVCLEYAVSSEEVPMTIVMVMVGLARAPGPAFLSAKRVDALRKPAASRLPQCASRPRSIIYTPSRVSKRETPLFCWKDNRTNLSRADGIAQLAGSTCLAQAQRRAGVFYYHTRTRHTGVGVSCVAVFP